jgi:hypothetical protein
MMTDRKKPGVAFWATVVLAALLVGYPLSFGPACWLTSQELGFLTSPPPQDRLPRAMIVYWPLGRLALSQSPLRKPVQWWMALGLRRGNAAVVPTSMKRDLLIVR